MSEYNPLNERLKKQYEESMLHDDHRDPKTADKAWKAINEFERFTKRADLHTLTTEQAKGFKRWYEKQTNTKGEPLSLSTVRSNLKALRGFFTWLKLHPQYGRKFDGRAIGYFRLSNNDDRASRATRELPAPSMEKLHTVLAAMPYETSLQKRDRAVIAFTALTGVRDAALISLKVKDVDRAKGEIWQNPRHVKTKRRKGIITTFMPFDPLWLEIVHDWLDYAEKELQLKQNDPLFPKTEVVSNPETLKFEVVGLTREHWANTTPVREIFKRAFHAVGLSYYNPHSIRKTLALFVQKHGTPIQITAFSQNIGHDNIVTTISSYARLDEHTCHETIKTIGTGDNDLTHVPSEILAQEMQRRMNG